MDLVLSNFAERGVCVCVWREGEAKLVVLRPFEKDKQHNWMEAGRSGRGKKTTLTTSPIGATLDIELYK